MKQSVLLFSFAASFMYCAAQVKDTVLTEISVNNNWQNNNRQIITYNSACAYSNTVTTTWEAFTQSWVNSNQGNYLYENNGRLTSFVSQNWDVINSVWVNGNRNIISYNDPVFTVSTQQIWDATTLAWVNTLRSITSVNGNGEVFTSRTDFYEDNKWVPGSLISISYDTENRPLEIKSQVWQAGSWVKSSRSVFTYNGKRLGINYYWDNNTGLWVKTSRDISAYLLNTDNAAQTRSQYFTNNAWLNSFRSRLEYGLYNDVYLNTRNFGELWDAAVNDWINFFGTTSDYYADGAIQYNTFQLWDAGANTWSIIQRNTFTHNNTCQLTARLMPVPETQGSHGEKKAILHNSLSETIHKKTDAHTMQYDYLLQDAKSNKQLSFNIQLTAGIKSKPVHSAVIPQPIKAKAGDMIIAPNPAKNYFTVNTGNTINAGIVMVKLADISGKVILQQKLQGSGNQRIMLPAIPSGLYIVTLTSGTSVQNSKLFID